jgi:hypothetical protein
MVVLVAVVSSWTVAWLAPCSVHDPSSREEAGDCCDKKHDGGSDEDGDEHGCSCPLECGPCCAGMPAPAVIAVAPVTPALLPSYTLLSFAPVAGTASEGASIDILHVPRS